MPSSSAAASLCKLHPERYMLTLCSMHRAKKSDLMFDASREDRRTAYSMLRSSRTPRATRRDERLDSVSTAPTLLPPGHERAPRGYLRGARHRLLAAQAAARAPAQPDLPHVHVRTRTKAATPQTDPDDRDRPLPNRPMVPTSHGNAGLC